MIVTIKPGSTSAGATTYSLPNIHGDVYLTVDADGLVKVSHQTGPFGEALPNQTNPANTATGTTWNYLGQHQKLTDSDTSPISGGIIQMGARTYIPALGRFLSVDSKEGGTSNNYVYALDPINDFDLTGEWSWKSVISAATKIANAASFIPGPIGMISAGVAVAGNLAQGNLMGALGSAVGFIPGGRALASIASMSKVGTKALTKVMSLQARAPVIGANSKLFGITSKANNGRFRVGWSQGTKSKLNFRIGVPGSHKALLGYKFNTQYKFHNVLKGIWK
jgi:RHS repeat-associated protein